ncbi:unnamed protein product [Cylindrotheca closterium]|uniref:Uncharacterized protein n=1 Tax=Cylindrotheca closterium TaxID=2856 RepID=A0AAD2G305_9STRA|nr:unnamed protein product [Cylindrotheca closterium]
MSEEEDQEQPLSKQPPISQKSVVLCSMLMFRMGKEARKQTPVDHDLFNPYEPVPIPVLLQMALVFFSLMAVTMISQYLKHNSKVRDGLRQKLQSTFKMVRSTDAFVFCSALFG